MNGFVDLSLEPPLWFITSGIFFFLGIFFLIKFIKAEKEAKFFFSGLTIFMFLWSVARLFETIRRYYVGSYYDIFPDFNITGLNLILRLLYIVISWAGVAYFFFVVETKIAEKKSYYILTIVTCIQIFVSCFTYLIVPLRDILNTATIILFLAITISACVIFFYMGFRSIGIKKSPWLMLSIGLFLFVLGIAGDNPEAQGIVTLIWAPIVHYGMPILVISGMLLMSIAAMYLYTD